MDAFNFLYVQFFVTDVDEGTGPHVMIKGSHKGIPLSMLFASVRQTDEAILRTFGQERTYSLTGKAGLGFIEDTFVLSQGPAAARGGSPGAATDLQLSRQRGAATRRTKP